MPSPSQRFRLDGNTVLGNANRSKLDSRDNLFPSAHQVTDELVGAFLDYFIHEPKVRKRNRLNRASSSRLNPVAQRSSSPTANVIGPTFSWRAVRPSRGADLRALTREASVCSTQASSLTGFIFALKTTRASKKRIERKTVTGWWTRQGRPEEKLLAQVSVAFQCASNKTFRDFIQSCSVLHQLVHQQID
ncbi:hypothetical protein H4Q26_008403 [Puccinia striiformis f. sp. tritici PST-130]|nr:hypothetical protein H4Q26_008403 [Puccinia striiformis f. sp. tritici PST-130]